MLLHSGLVLPAGDLERLLRSHGAVRVACSSDVALAVSRVPPAAMSSSTLESDAIARAVLTDLRAPTFSSVSLVVHPRAVLDAPLLLAHVRGTTGRGAHGMLAICGSAASRRAFEPRLRQCLEGAPAVARTRMPSWIAPLAGVASARVFIADRVPGELVRLLEDYIETYLALLASARNAADPAATGATVRTVADAFRAHAAGLAIPRLFGALFAARHDRLVWCDD